MRLPIVSLRRKLGLGFAGLLLVMALIGIRGIYQITDLGRSIQDILKENYLSVIACQDMQEAVERMNDGAMLILLGQRSEGIRIIRLHIPKFEKALDVELNNITEPGEGAQSLKLKHQYARYKATILAMEAEGLAPGRVNAIYTTELAPLFSAIKTTADQILTVNQQHMFLSSQEARRKAAQSRHAMYVLLLAGAAVAIGYVLLIGKWILRPIERLTRSVEEIRQGNLDLVLASDSRDEIGRLSEAFNEMTAGLRAFRRNGQAKLDKLQHSAQLTFDNLPHAMAMVDQDGTIELATQKARAIFGLKPQAQLKDLGYPWLQELFEAAASGRLKPAEETPVIQHFHGAAEHYFRPMAVPILDSRRQPSGVILIINDVTAQLEQDELKKGLISTVSHQLKTPLTAVRLALHILIEEKVGPLNAKQADLVISAHEESERLSGIIDGLLAMSRIEAGKAGMDPHPVEAWRLVHDAVAGFQAEARDRGLHLVAEVPDDMPEVMADSRQIGQVFANLISNALKYTSSGGKVRIHAEVLERLVWFMVSDTGSGIPADHLPHVFERFYRIPGQAEQSGSGLGLSIVKQIIEAHGGTVKAESTPGTGSAFYFSLPRADHFQPGR